MKHYLTHSSVLLRELAKFLLATGKSLTILEDLNTVCQFKIGKGGEKCLEITHLNKDFEIFISEMERVDGIEYRCEFLSANRTII